MPLIPDLLFLAAGAMLSLIVVELLPDAYADRRRFGPTVGVAIGAAVMLALGV